MSKETYHVAAILNEFEIVINAGTNYGISKGDAIEVFEVGNLIKDPITEEDLGPLIFVKVQVEVVQVDEKYCICKKFEEEEEIIRSTMSNFYSTMEQISSPRTKTIIHKTSVPINIEAAQSLNLKNPTSRSSSKVKIGDLARIPF